MAGNGDFCGQFAIIFTEDLHHAKSLIIVSCIIIDT